MLKIITRIKDTQNNNCISQNIKNKNINNMKSNKWLILLTLIFGMGFNGGVVYGSAMLETPKSKKTRLQEELTKREEKWREERDKIETFIEEEDIRHVISEITNIPIKRLLNSESKRLIDMEEELHQKVVGQKEAIASISRAIRRSRAGLKTSKRPLGSFIFLGPTGVGKTALAKVLSEFMFGDSDALIRIDMSEFMEKFAVSRLIGAPPGYVGYEEGGGLNEKVRRKPYSLILFDEIEKAHPDVANILLQVLEEGQLTDNLKKS